MKSGQLSDKTLINYDNSVNSTPTFIQDDYRVFLDNNSYIFIKG